MNADGSAQTNLTKNDGSDKEPNWSPDGMRLAFSSNRGGAYQIYTMNLNGSRLRKLTDSAAVDGGPRWSPDGSRIAFYSFRDRVRGLLWLMDANGSDPTALLGELLIDPSGRCLGGFPGGWFPDGNRLVFRGSQGDISALQVCAIDSDGSDAEVLLSEKQTFSIDPAVSRDGRRIAFTTNRDDNIEIYVMDADGGSLRRLTNDEAIDLQPTWSPDGRQIAFISDRDGDFEIYVMDADGGNLRQLTRNRTDDMNPAWSPF